MDTESEELLSQLLLSLLMSLSLSTSGPKELVVLRILWITLLELRLLLLELLMEADSRASKGLLLLMATGVMVVGKPLLVALELGLRLGSWLI